MTQLICKQIENSVSHVKQVTLLDGLIVGLLWDKSLIITK